MRKASFPLLILLYASSVLAAPAEVIDEGRFFSPDTIATANQQLSQIKQQHGVDLRIETYPSVPSELRSQYNPDRRAQFFTQWGYQRAKAAGMTGGAIVLITREPSYLQVVVGESTRRGAFTQSDRDRLRDTMLASFKQKRYDEGLLSGIDVFRQAVSSPDQSAAAPASPSASGARSASDSPAATRTPVGQPSFSIGKLLFWGALILIGIFLIRRMFARRASQYPTGGSPMNPQGQHDPYNNQGYGAPGYGAGAGAGAGGGGFGRGFGGGILGGLLGGWLGGRMFGGGGHQAFGSTTPPPDQSADPNAGGGVFSDQAHQQDFMADQGGFQDLGGGGDFGGDAGGGDSGGGGDF